jgi:hypothetical protein
VNDAILAGMEIEPENRTATVLNFREDLGLVSSGNPGDVELKSSCGMDYRKLRDLLKAGEWQKADDFTYRLMLLVANREKEKEVRLDIEDIDNFPCEDLRTIDQLWIKYSDGKFGFSVQKRIYQGFGGTREYNSDIWEKFGDKVGWREGGYWLYYKDITFDKKAAEGHLPAFRVWLVFHGFWFHVLDLEGVLFSRVETCKL